MSVAWPHNRYHDSILPSGSGTTSSAYGGWFAKQNIPSHMYNRFGSLNSRQLNPVSATKKYHTPSENDMSYVSGHVPALAHSLSSGAVDSAMLPYEQSRHVPYPQSNKDEALLQLGRSSYRPAINLSNTTGPPNISPDKTLILLSPQTSIAAATSSLTNGLRRDNSIYQSPIMRQATMLKSNEDNARLIANRLALQRSSTHLGINQMTSKYSNKLTDEMNKGLTPTITESTLSRSNSFTRNQISRSTNAVESPNKENSTSGSSSKNHPPWLAGNRNVTLLEDKPSFPSEGQSNTQPYTMYRHGSFVTPTVTTVRSDSVKVENGTGDYHQSSNQNRFNSANIRRKETLDQLNSNGTIASTHSPSTSDYSMLTSAPRPNDPIISVTTRSIASRSPKSILKKSKRGDSSLSFSSSVSSIRQGRDSVHFSNNQGTVTNYPWSAPSGDQLLSVPNVPTSQQSVLRKPPPSPSKRVSFNI